ncbi:MAG: AAA family ATPase [Candidatus Hydrogenedentota bacterium]|nr:MAG: AAA family ATPase [Candidatus Hydrogenedentota bacterium]
MKICKLSIDGFGLFDGRFDLQIPEGIAVIVGDNETGKSTLLAAVETILFGFRTENERAVFAPHRTSAPRCGSLEIEANDNRYRFSRDFVSNHARVELLEKTNRILFDGSAKPGGRTEEKEAYDNVMRSLFGLEERDLFHNSILVEQSGLRPKMEGIVRRIASGTSSTDYSVALENLKKAYEELTVEVPWGRRATRKPRRIERLETECQEKKRALSEAREVGAHIEESRDRLALLESQLSDISIGIANHRAWEKDLSSFSIALEEKKHLEEELNDCRNQMREIERLTAELRICAERIRKEYSEYASLPEKAEAEVSTLVRLRENKSELEEKYRQTEIDIPRLRPPRFSVAAIAGGLFVAGLGMILFNGAPRAMAVLTGIGICAWPLMSAITALRSRKSARSAKLQEIRDQLDFLKDQSAEIEQHYPALSREDLSDVLERLRELRDLRQEKEKKEEVLKHHPTLSEIESKFNSLSNELVLADKKLENLKSQRPSLGDVERSGQLGKAIEEVKGEILRLEKQLAELNEVRDETRLRLAAAEAKETISEEKLEEEISEAQSELNRLKLVREAHLTAVKVLEEAISEFRSSHLARIEKKASDYLSRITGTECRVQLDQRLEPLGIEEAGQYFERVQLSQGVSDQLYFALRLAAIEEVCGDVRLPILLDDPFVNFDENRLKATLDMLERVSESHQIVLFTHDRRYCDWRRPACLLKR